MKKNQNSIINAWCMYDWANSVYSLVISTAVFPAFYNAYTAEYSGGDTVEFFGFHLKNSVLYSYSLSFSFLFVAVVVPFLSGIADYKRNKKSFMKGFVYIGALACSSLYLFDGSNVELGIIAAVIASIGFSGSLVFYDAFLPEIVTEDKMDKVSAKGYALGYIGSVLLLIFTIFSIQNFELLGFESSKDAMRFSFLLVGIWWLVFSLIPFYYLKESKIENAEVKKDYLWSGYRELLLVYKSLVNFPVLKGFLVSFFFYNTGVQTIILLASTFAAKVLGMEGSKLILTILIIQIVAIFGAFLFAYISKRIGNRKSLLIMIVCWLVVCTAAYLVQSEEQFFGVAFLVGLVLGGIQSQSRSTYSKLLPENTTDTASFFSFYDSTYYISVVIGTFSYGLVEQLTENMRLNALVLASYFLIGGILLFRLPMHFKSYHNIAEE